MSDSPYSGLLGGVIRPRLEPRDLRQAFFAASIMYALAALAVSPFWATWPTDDGRHPFGIAFAAATAVGFAVALGVVVPRMSDEQMLRHGGWLAALANAGSVLLVAFLTYWVGPHSSFSVLFFAPMMLYAFMFFRPRYGQLLSVGLLGAFAVSLVAQNHPPYPVEQWLVVAAMAIGVGRLVGGMASRIDEARTDLAGLNERLRRFLAPQVVDVIAEEDALAPHRRNIAVCFVDLRGFTAFTNAVTADRVMSVLDEYYSAVGSVLDAYDATIGGFDGDGVFAYLGDPKPHDDPAGEAVAMAREIATKLDALTASWGGGLGYGIGLTFGEATLGMVGFVNRADYTPVGAPVNLAARLCADALHGEIVVDDNLRTAAALGDLPKRPEVDVKGFGEIATYAVAH